MLNRHPIRQVAVLGAGVMGAQISAHLANAGLSVILYDLAATNGDAPNRLVDTAIDALSSLRPAALTCPSNSKMIRAGNYEQHLAWLADCDLVIEAISEKISWKLELYRMIIPHINNTALLVSNTSGLSINQLAEVLPASLRERYCGLHFFNPPRYMPLVELIPSDYTTKENSERLETFVTQALGKNVVRAFDTPNFIANRVGIFSLLSTITNAEHFDIGLDVVDELTGSLIGRAKSATLRTIDLVGLDTYAYTLVTMQEGLLNDPWNSHYCLPKWMSELVDKGALGKKTHAGIYKKENDERLVYDIKAGGYRVASGQANKEVVAIMAQRDTAERFRLLRNAKSQEAQFLLACYRDLFQYCATHVSSIAESVRDVDLALRWGFGWRQGPFELWQAIGWSEMAEQLQTDITANLTLSNTPLPEWVKTTDAVYDQTGRAFSPRKQQFIERKTLGVYQRHYSPQTALPGEKSPAKQNAKTYYENDGVHLWSLNDVAVLSFKTKMGVITEDVLTGVPEALSVAETCAQGVIIWHAGSHFSVGADLTYFKTCYENQDIAGIRSLLEKFETASMALRTCAIPTVAAVRGFVLGGGCELMLHCHRVVAAQESQIGLVETGVGLLPAGGGCKEMLRRALAWPTDELRLAHLQYAYEQIVQGIRSSSAVQARALGYLRAEDTITMQVDELLYLAEREISVLSESGYRAPVSATLMAVPGEAHASVLYQKLCKQTFFEKASSHDQFIAKHIAAVMVGADLDDTAALIDEHALFALEQTAFLKLIEQEKTQERIAYLLETGKLLSN